MLYINIARGDRSMDPVGTVELEKNSEAHSFSVVDVKFVRLNWNATGTVFEEKYRGSDTSHSCQPGHPYPPERNIHSIEERLHQQAQDAGEALSH
jgi:hypothetical protein